MIIDDWSDFVYWMEDSHLSEVKLSNLSYMTDPKLSSITYCGPFYFLQIVVSISSLTSAGSASCTIGIPDDCIGTYQYSPSYIGSNIAVGSINVAAKSFGLRNCSSGIMTGNLYYFFTIYRKF